MLEVDADNVGALDFQQYVRLMENLLGEWDFSERLIEAFKVFDTDDVDSISVVELKHVMETLDFKMTEEDTDEFLQAGLSAGNSADRIDYRAFAKVMTDALAANAAGKKKGSKKKGKKGKSKKKKKK
jgi:calcium-binding protein CML